MRRWIPAILCAVVLLLYTGATGAKPATTVSMQVKRILVVNQSPAVLLVDEPEQNYLLVFIDFFMANAIRMGMEEPRLPRPLTHDLIGIFLQQLGAKVTKIAITELRGNTYYALITIDVNGRVLDIDARPSDALAIAVRMKSPIYAAPALLKPMRDPEAPPLRELPRDPRHAVPAKRETVRSTRLDSLGFNTGVARQ